MTKASGDSITGSKRGSLALGGVGLATLVTILPSVLDNVESFPMEAIIGALVLLGVLIIMYGAQDLAQTIFDRKQVAKREDVELQLEVIRAKADYYRAKAHVEESKHE